MEDTLGKKNNALRVCFDVLFSSNHGTYKELDKKILSSMKKKGRLAVIVVYEMGESAREIRIFPTSAKEHTLVDADQILLGKLFLTVNMYVMQQASELIIKSVQKWAGYKTGNPIFDCPHIHIRLARDIDTEGLIKLIHNQL